MTPTQTGSTFSPSLPGGKQMLRKSALILGIVGMLTAMGSVFAQSTANDVPFPNGFRDWFLVNTMIVTKDSPIFGQIGGLHHIYVNTVAFPTLKASGPYPYPDGSIFADDVHDFSVKEGSYVEGSKKAATVMVKDSKKYASTGGWGFQVWVGGDPAKPLIGDATKPCFVCHTPQKSQDFTFSTYIP
jgi:Cytochrome P460